MRRQNALLIASISLLGMCFTELATPNAEAGLRDRGGDRPLRTPGRGGVADPRGIGDPRGENDPRSDNFDDNQNERRDTIDDNSDNREDNRGEGQDEREDTFEENQENREDSYDKNSEQREEGREDLEDDLEDVADDIKDGDLLEDDPDFRGDGDGLIDGDGFEDDDNDLLKAATIGAVFSSLPSGSTSQSSSEGSYYQDGASCYREIPSDDGEKYEVITCP